MKKPLVSCFAAAVLVLLAAGAARHHASQDYSRYPADSARLEAALKSFRLEDGLSIELIASEPLVVDPVAFTFDEKNQLYVIEDRGYPDPIDGSTAPAIGRIALLRDLDKDGKFETRTDFVTELTYPNGVLPWKGGIFVTCAPHIYYFKDTDNDGIADIKEIVLTGFNSNQTAQIRVSHPSLGLDGWVYVTSGLNNGNITSPRHPERPAVKFTSADGRFDPETFEFQNTGGRSQFGLAFDPFGRRFGTSNRHPVMQAILEPWHLRRNPSLQFTETHQNVSTVEAEAKVFPISGAVTTAEFIPRLMGLSHTGTFTSACGLLIYNGNALTDAHKGNVFICEPAQNLVQRQVMKSKGVGFTSSLPYQGKEFLASTDEWFRPVFLQHGPDGSLYLADMYRKVIDHPSYVPAESRHLLDFESGKTDGRLYRIFETGKKAGASKWDPGMSGTPGRLMEALSSDNEWARETAFRKIIEQKDASLVPALRQTLKQASLAETRTRVLWLLYHLQAADDEIFRLAFADKVPEIREQAVKIAGLSHHSSPTVNGLLIKAADDQDLKVRFATALALGDKTDPQSVAALARIAGKNGDDQWVRNAVLSSISGKLPEFLAAFQAQKANAPAAHAAVMQDLGRLFGNAAPIEDCRNLMKSALKPGGNLDWRISTLLGLAEGVSKRSESRQSGLNPLAYLAGNQEAQLHAFMKNVNQRVALANLPVAERKNAVALLGYYQFDLVKNTLAKMLDTRNPPEVQIEAVSALKRLGDPEGARYLTAAQTWSAYTPRVKNAVVASLVYSNGFVPALLDAIEKGTVRAAEINSTDRQHLLKNKDKAIADRAASYFSELESGGRMKIYQDFRSHLSKPAVAAEGKEVFLRNCSACHSYAAEKGGNVGPDLTGIRNQPAEAILLHVLVPNYEVYPAYQTVNIETNDGNTASGWLVAETDNSITLRTAFSTEVSVLRKNIKSLTNPGISLMPDGLEQAMTEQELLNLIAYLKAGN